MPATKELAKLYQLNMVEYQCASMLINHNQGMEDIIVRANSTIYPAAQTVFFQMYFFPSSTLNGASSMLRDSWRIFLPNHHHPTIVMMVHTVKKVGFKNPDL